MAAVEFPTEQSNDAPVILTKAALDRTFDERRESGRVDADLSVRVSVLKPSQHELFINTFDELRRRFMVSVEFSRLKLTSREAAKSKTFTANPELAVFAESMEKRLDMLASMSGLQTHGVDLSKPQTVSISANGLKFAHPESMDPTTMVLLRMVSLNSPMLALIVLANVVRCSVERDNDTGAHVGVAVQFHHLHKIDKAQLQSFLKLKAQAAV